MSRLVLVVLVLVIVFFLAFVFFGEHLSALLGAHLGPT